MVIGHRRKSKKVTGEPSLEEETDGRIEGTDDVFRCQTMLAEYKTEEWPRTDALTDGRTGDGRTEPWTTFEGTGTGRERERDDVGARLPWMGL